jgi:hypothetical protein
MPILLSTPHRRAAPDYAFSLANEVPAVLASGASSATAPVQASTAFDPVYHDDLTRSVATTVRLVERALHRYALPRMSMADYVFVEPPDDSTYPDAFIWERVAVRIVEDHESGYVGDGDVWR